MRTIAKIVLVTSLTCAMACSRPANQGEHSQSETPKVDEIEQLVLFQQSYINHAWGYQNRGWFIDRDGYMKAYQIVGRGDTWHRAEEAGPDRGHIAQTALEENYAKADRIIFRVPKEELLEKFRLIATAANGPYSPSARTAYDAGAVYFLAYLLDKDKVMYRQVLLSLSGDFSQFNENPAAGQLEEWLVGLNQIYADSLAAWQR